MNEEEEIVLQDRVDALMTKVDEQDDYLWRLECILREKVPDFPKEV